jgi:hypothetical protein
MINLFEKIWIPAIIYHLLPIAGILVSVLAFYNNQANLFLNSTVLIWSVGVLVFRFFNIYSP